MKMSQEEIENAQAQELLNTAKLHEQIIDLGNAAESGWINAIEAYVELKKIEAILKIAADKIKDAAIDDAEKQNEKEFKMFGAKIAIRNSGAGWDYSNVPQISELKERMKSYEQLAINAAAEAKFGNKVFDGEGVEISPAERKEGKTNIFITLDKN
jgi:hypothetical protein